MKIKFIIGFLILAGFMACIEEDGNAVEGAGNNYIRIPAGSKEINIAGLDAVPGNVKYALFTVIRDPNSQSSLNAASEVKLKLDNSLITAYNTAHGTSLVPLEGGYTLESLDLKFAAGEYSKTVYLNLDPSKLDLSKKFGLGIGVESATGGYTVVPSLSKALFNIVIKNEWDGRYQAVGVFHHPTAGDRAINEVKDFVTTGARSVEGNLGDLGGAGYRMDLTVNADNTVTIAKRGVTPNINQTHGPNTYDPVARAFKLHYSYNVAAPRIIEETITLK